MKYERREYDHGDSELYAFEKDYIYGCHNDVACLLYDRLIKHCIVPRKPNQLIVSEEFPLTYGFSHTKAKAYIDKQNYVLELTIGDEKQFKFAKMVCEALKVGYEVKEDIFDIIMPLSTCTLSIEEYFEQNDIPLEYSNRLGFKQYPDNKVVEIEDDIEEDDENEWGRYDLCSILFEI